MYSNNLVKILFVFIAVFGIINFGNAYPLNEDLDHAATGHEHGRVQIKVYRGPGDHHFAPWGYWFKQPADDHH